MQEKINKMIYLVVLLVLIISTIFIIIKIIMTSNNPSVVNQEIRGNYVLMLIQCLMGIIAMLLPSIIFHKLKLKLPSKMYLSYVIFLFCAIFLGEVRNFYYEVSYWDNLLHVFSGAMLGALGFSVVMLLNEADNLNFELSPAFIALFAFCFAITIGVVWEIYEYTFDGVLCLNMQKFALENGTKLVGREALTDTMIDLMIDCIGASVMCLIGYISLKQHNRWIGGILIKPKSKE